MYIQLSTMNKTIFLLLIIGLSNNAIYVPNNIGLTKSKTVDGVKQNGETHETTSQWFGVIQNYTNVKVQKHDNADNLKQIYENNLVGNSQAHFKLHDVGVTLGTTTERNNYSFPKNEYPGLPQTPNFKKVSEANSGKVDNICNTTNCGHRNIYTHQEFFVPQNYFSGKLQEIPRRTQTFTQCPTGSTGQYPIEYSCNQFLNCWNGRGVIQNCSPGTLFNPVTFECDYPAKVICISGSKSKRFVIEDLSEKQQANCPTGFSGIIPHYNDCSKFLNCDNGKQHVMACPPGTLFDMRSNICDHSFKVTCAKGRQSEPLKVDNGNRQEPSSHYNKFHVGHGVRQNSNQPQVSQKTDIQRAKCPQLLTGLMRHPYDCSKFLSCANGMTHIMNCGPGTLFNPSTKVCDYPYNVKCSANFVDELNSNINENHHGNVHKTSENLEGNYQGKLEQHSHHPGGIKYEQIGAKYGRYQERQTTMSYEILIDAGSSYNNKQWPPVFPSAADYGFEYEDLNSEPDVNLEKNIPKIYGSNITNWCERSGFECEHKICISPSFVCDGQKDCPNGKDEIDCDLSLNGFLKISETKLAILEVKKMENVTLPWCAKSCIQANGKSFNYRKHGGTCYILDSNVGLSGALIKLPMYDYYEDRKYSINCNKIGGYLCQNQKCITKHKLCDGVNDCGDGYDEKGCTADAFDYKVRLIGGSAKYNGRIEVQAFGKIGYVCDDMFGLKNADVVCREVGFPLGAVEVRGNSFFAEDVMVDQTIYIMDDVRCIGNETSLRDCDFNGWGINNCQPQEIVGVVCKTPVQICPKEHWQCSNNLECLPLAFVCDGVYDCSDKSDENEKLCDSPTEMRLSQGTQGRVEIMHNGMWGTICDDDFNDEAAKVVCNQLGYGRNAKVVKDGFFGPGSGPIWLDQVFCRGNESTLDDCIHWDWGEHNCEHSEDVGVVCNEFSGQPRNSHIGTNKINMSNVLNSKLPGRCGLRSDAIFSNQEEIDVPHFRVVSASVARVGEYPWQASIRVSGKTKAAHWCGAVVISSLYVLTAAHCLSGFSKGAYLVVAGDYNVDRYEGIEQQAFIQDFIVHPQFGHGNKMNNDIALIRLKGSGFQITKDVQPICLPEEDFNYPVGYNCTISGFGSIESGKSKASKDLHAGWIPILSKEICEMPHVYGSAMTPGMLCAGFMESGVDACDGDSGGPLACLHEGVFKLFGITSWGQHCGYANKPGVYVNVAKYRKWIEETMKKC